MKAKEIRAKARELLSGKWKKFIGLNLLYVLTVLALAAVGIIPFVGYVIMMALLVPIEYGYIQNLFKLVRGQTDKCTEFLSLGFSNFGRAWGVFGYTMLKVIILMAVYVLGIMLSVSLITLSILANNVYVTLFVSLLVVVLFVIIYIWLFIRMMLYTFPVYIAVDEPELLPKDCVEKSATIMKGNRIKYILFSLSFIGWSILATLTLGIGYIWLLPYISVATVVFYETINKKEEVKVVDENNEAVVNAEEVIVENK